MDSRGNLMYRNDSLISMEYTTVPYAQTKNQKLINHKPKSEQINFQFTIYMGDVNTINVH